MLTEADFNTRLRLLKGTRKHERLKGLIAISSELLPHVSGVQRRMHRRLGAAWRDAERLKRW